MIKIASNTVSATCFSYHHFFSFILAAFACAIGVIVIVTPTLSIAVETINPQKLQNETIGNDTGLLITKVDIAGNQVPINDPNYPGKYIIKFREKNIAENDISEFVNFDFEYQLGSEKVILLSLASGGIACEATYRIISVTNDKAWASAEFGNCNPPEINASNNEIKFSFYDGYGKRIINIYKTHHLVESKIVLPLHYDSDGINGDFHYLQKYVDQSDIENILIDSELKPHLERMMKKNFSNFKDRLEVIVPPIVSNAYLIITGAKPHSFGSDEAFLAVALDGSGIYTATLSTNFIPTQNASEYVWEEPAEFIGVYHKSKFNNCCVSGKETLVDYNDLALPAPVIIKDGSPENYKSLLNVAHVEIGIKKEALIGIHEGDNVYVKCRSLWQGTTGHYALPVYCVADSIDKQVARKINAYSNKPAMYSVIPEDMQRWLNGFKEVPITWNYSSTMPSFNHKKSDVLDAQAIHVLSNIKEKNISSEPFSTSKIIAKSDYKSLSDNHLTKEQENTGKLYVTICLLFTFIFSFKRAKTWWVNFKVRRAKSLTRMAKKGRISHHPTIRL